MSDEDGSIPDEGGVAEDVVRMAMGVDDVADRLVGPGTNGREQLLSLTYAAPGIDDRNRALADDETDIGDRAVVLARHQRGLADVHEDTGRDFVNRQWLLLRLREGWRDEQGESN